MYDTSTPVSVPSTGEASVNVTLSFLTGACDETCTDDTSTGDAPTVTVNALVAVAVYANFSSNVNVNSVPVDAMAPLTNCGACCGAKVAVAVKFSTLLVARSAHPVELGCTYVMTSVPEAEDKKGQSSTVTVEPLLTRFKKVTASPSKVTLRLPFGAVLEFNGSLKVSRMLFRSSLTTAEVTVGGVKS